MFRAAFQIALSNTALQCCIYRKEWEDPRLHEQNYNATGKAVCQLTAKTRTVGLSSSRQHGEEFNIRFGAA